MQRSALCRSRRELSNAYLLAKIGVDTAETEPLEVWGENSIQYSLHSLLLIPSDHTPSLGHKHRAGGHVVADLVERRDVIVRGEVENVRTVDLIGWREPDSPAHHPADDLLIFPSR